MSCFPNVWPPAALSYFTATVSLLLAFIIISGNIAIIVAIVRDPFKKLRTPFNYFLINLVTSDLLVGCVTMMISVLVHFKEPTGQVDPNLIKAIHLSYFISSTASVLSLGVLSLDRYIAITWPIKYRKHLSLARFSCISISIWVLSFSLPMLYLLTGYINYLMVFIHVSVLITFLILILTHRQVSKSLQKNADDLKCCSSSNIATQEQRKIKQERKVTNAFLSILLLFICTYMPAVIMIYILEFCAQCNCTARNVLRDLQFLIISANSGMNPYVCAVRLKAFRKTIWALIYRNSEVTCTTPDTGRTRKVTTTVPGVLYKVQ